MNWQEITRHLEQAETLSPEALASFLTELDTKGSDISGPVRAFLERTMLGKSFMQTSVDPAAALTARVLPEGTEIGVWQIDKLIGAGGMGEVYRAKRGDGLYEQTVALKVMQAGTGASRTRFERERQRLASLDHPGISRIIDGGQTPDDRPYMAMEYVEGVPIDQFASDKDRKETLLLFAELSEAVAHAHSRLVLHRDIKPGNVLVDLDGKVKLIDFGVASLLDGDEDLSGGPLTIAYAAPEQLTGAPISVGTDVFQLGMLLHQLLTGRPAARSPDGSVRADLNALGHADLASIVSRAVSHDPAIRYSSASTLGDDVRAYLNNRPVESHTGGFGYRFSKAVKRAPLASALTGALAAALIAGTAISVNYANVANREANAAIEALRQAEIAEERSRISGLSERAFSETILRLFNTGIDSEELTDALFERADEAWGVRDIDPDNAAMTAFAVGRTFSSLRESENAAKVLEPWISEAYGPKDLYWKGKIELAYSLRRLGEKDKSLELLREAQTFAKELDDPSTYHLVLIQYQIAQNTFLQEDWKELIEIAEKAYSAGATGNAKGFYLNALDMGYTRTGQFEKAAEFAHQSVEFAESSPFNSRGGVVTARHNAAVYDIYHTKNYDRARDLLQRNLEDSNLPKRRRSTSLKLMGELENEIGAHDLAEQYFFRSFAIGG